MARKLRIKRIVFAAVILIVLIAAIVWATVFFSRSKQPSDGGEGQTQQQSDQTLNSTQTPQTPQTNNQVSNVWPSELNSYIKEYKGAGSLVSAEKGQNSEGKTVFTVRYKGTGIEAAFAYAKEIGIDGEWTEVITDEEYTISKEVNAYTVDLASEPKGAKGYDLQITVKIK